MSIARQYVDTLSLIEVSGPFVSLNHLLEEFPNGLDNTEPELKKDLRIAYENWLESNDTTKNQYNWIKFVLTNVLGYPEDLVAEAQNIPPNLIVNVPEVDSKIIPNFCLLSPKNEKTEQKPKLLIKYYPKEQSLEKYVLDEQWNITPVTLMTKFLHYTKVGLGLITNGEQWMLVYAKAGEATGCASWYSTIWLDEPETLKLFQSLLGLRRFFGVKKNSTIHSLLDKGTSEQQEVTDQLGYQVREAVRVLIQSFNHLDERDREIINKQDPQELYNAALTIMMRLVFLLFAEEQELLHLGDPLYDDNYAVSTLQQQLQEVADKSGEEILERRTDAWLRLLATFRAIHGGVVHQDLHLQAYGGSLFDPNKYPFLEGRTNRVDSNQTTSEPISINNRVILHLLNSLQLLETKVPGSKIPENRPVSFRALGIEQIGQVYEGLLDHTANRSNEISLVLEGSKNSEIFLELSELELNHQEGDQKLVDFIIEQTKFTQNKVKTELSKSNEVDFHKLSLACKNNTSLTNRIKPFAGLLKSDTFGRLYIVLPSDVFVTPSSERSSTGTHYTPTSLTEPIVQFTLEPLVYDGPKEGIPRKDWKLKSADQILNLRVCDPAMGSGAFLVQTCRYLAEKLAEAWNFSKKESSEKLLTTPRGDESEGNLSERLLPDEKSEQISIARRLIADKCLYGVDINPMAVEMAKLSIWLITVDKKRPFTFLDHAFKCGDTLFGLSTMEQLENFDFHPDKVKQYTLGSHNLKQFLNESQVLRETLIAKPSETIEDINVKIELNSKAMQASMNLRCIADTLVSIENDYYKNQDIDLIKLELVGKIGPLIEGDITQLQKIAREILNGRKPMHWNLSFPEIMINGGFDAIVGNPPFLGGWRISSSLGQKFMTWITKILFPNSSGNADLVSFFLLRTHALLRPGGVTGLIATNTLAQSDTRTVGLGQLDSLGSTIIRAVQNMKWPGTAGIICVQVWYYKGKWKGVFFLNETEVSGISSYLRLKRRITGEPKVLNSNLKKSFRGSNINVSLFVIKKSQADILIEKDWRNKDVLFPFMRGRDFTSHPHQECSDWVINFSDWPYHESKDATNSGKCVSAYPEVFQILEEKHKKILETKTNNVTSQNWWNLPGDEENTTDISNTLKRFLFHARPSKYVIFNFVPKNLVFASGHNIFLFDDYAHFALLQSTVHNLWAWEYCSTFKTDIRYSNRTLFETFPFPKEIMELEAIGQSFQQFRQQYMERTIQQETQIGLTEVYNKIHDKNCTLNDIQHLRELNIEMDKAVVSAYEWNDLKLEFDFLDTEQGLRFTLPESTRIEILDRLLELNHKQHEKEVLTGKVKSPEPKQKSKTSPQLSAPEGLFAQETELVTT